MNVKIHLNYTNFVIRVQREGKCTPKKKKHVTKMYGSPKILITNPSMYENQLYMLLKLCKRIVPRTIISITNAMCMLVGNCRLSHLLCVCWCCHFLLLLLPQLPMTTIQNLNKLKKAMGEPQQHKTTTMNVVTRNA
jgi:hypothetical protein